MKKIKNSKQPSPTCHYCKKRTGTRLIWQTALREKSGWVVVRHYYCRWCLLKVNFYRIFILRLPAYESREYMHDQEVIQRKINWINS